MKRPFLPLKPVLAVTIAGMGFASLLFSQPSLAQSGSDPFGNLNSQENDPLSPRSDEVSNMGMWSLFHRLQQGNTVLNADEQNQQLNDAAAAFKAKQQQLFRQNQTQQQQNQPGFQITTPGVIRPQSGK
ncbi:hypothetical protein BZZ01_28165 [Nostocales cyanobacterium HT-58-2]|nr:hypothetical protein BZZ01_28165 [Nostocales cyanobacterium HT-58-2]